MENYHIFKIIPFAAGHTSPAGVKIQSQRFNQSVKLTGDNAQTPEQYLKDRGFEIVGSGEGILDSRTRIKESFLISTTFKELS